MKIEIINDQDGNDTFVAEGDNLEAALRDALHQLGWSAYEHSEDDDEDEDEAESEE